MFARRRAQIVDRRQRPSLVEMPEGPAVAGLEALRFWFGATDYKHDEADSLPAPVIGSTFLQKQYEARMEAQHLPVHTVFGELRGAAGVQWSDRDLNAQGADGILLAPTNTQVVAGFLFEELASCQVAQQSTR